MTQTVCKLHAWRRITAFRNNRDGAVSVEFALIAAPFLLLLVGVIEVGAMLHAESSLQHATDKAGRLIRTGQVTTRSGATLMSAETFIEKLCGEATILKNCTEELSIDVQSEASFAELSSSMPSPLAVGPSEPDGSPVREFSPGGASKATSLVVTYDWPLSLSTIIPFGNIHDGSAQRLQAIAIFRNEPY